MGSGTESGAPPGNKFPEPIGTLGTGDHTLEHLQASGFPRRMCKKAA